MHEGSNSQVPAIARRQELIVDAERRNFPISRAPYPPPTRVNRRRIVTVAVVGVPVLAAALFFLFRPAIPGGSGGPEPRSSISKHEELTTVAWKAYEAEKDYAKAIQLAEECIDEFEPAAQAMQSNLESSHSTLPTGKVPPDIRDEIFANGPVNDIATCYYILGRSLEKTDEKEKAIVALKKCTEFSLGRCWDPKQDLFWNPSELAGYRVEKLSAASD